MKENIESKHTLTGKVVSNKMAKTVVVLVEEKIKHKYGKYIKRSTKLHVHDEGSSCKCGDLVLIKESRPISKTKNWCLVEVVKKMTREL
jgi:small subunit ribosomal protein S17